MAKTLTQRKLIENGKLCEYKVLFVCTGNTCRSPMAEVIYNDFAKKRGVDTIAKSAGLFADGSNISQHAKTALLENGLVDEDFTRSSVMITAEMCDEADLIVGMTDAHAMRLIMNFPTYSTKIKTLGKDIIDPFGGYLETYKKCFEEIREAIKNDFFPDAP